MILSRRILALQSAAHFQRPFSTKEFVKVVEVGPRDGLQNEPMQISTDVKIEFINRLSETGLKTIEVTSFVSPKWIPQMSDNVEVFKGIDKKSDISYPVLIPNLKGLQAALPLGIQEIAVFTSASEGFSQKNTNCSIRQSLERIKEIVQEAIAKNIKIRGYISCVVGCPYEGYIKPKEVSKVAETLLSLGCYEISLGDTIGVGTRTTMRSMLTDLLKFTKPDALAIHCHDTYGQALVNIFTALEYGIRTVDSSVSGLGGCPYAAGATGNVATEDLIYMLNGVGFETGLDLNKLVSVGHYISEKLNKPSVSKVNNALWRKL